jgi:hypothetical protein
MLQAGFVFIITVLEPEKNNEEHTAINKADFLIELKGKSI